MKLEVKFFAINETISSHQLSKLKNYFDKINVCSLCMYSNNRDTTAKAVISPQPLYEKNFGSLDEVEDVVKKE